MNPVHRMLLAATLVLPLALVACGDEGAGTPGTDVIDDHGGGDGPVEGCVPTCGNHTCGDDGCGGSCGACEDGQVCNPVFGKCLGGCTADCTGKACGSNGCGGSCGDCGLDEDCFEGTCAAKASCTDGSRNGTETDVDWNSTTHLNYVMYCPADGGGTCSPACNGKACGDDGCGGSCGTCTDGQACSASGLCGGGGGGCGADANSTCQGTCGQQSSSGSCWCNSSCASYGDCCPDYAACCG